jgi:hypothetical protein
VSWGTDMTDECGQLSSWFMYLNRMAQAFYIEVGWLAHNCYLYFNIAVWLFGKFSSYRTNEASWLIYHRNTR